jgi:hypothetical protein
MSCWQARWRCGAGGEEGMAAGRGCGRRPELRGMAVAIENRLCCRLYPATEAKRRSELRYSMELMPRCLRSSWRSFHSR